MNMKKMSGDTVHHATDLHADGEEDFPVSPNGEIPSCFWDLAGIQRMREPRFLARPPRFDPMGRIVFTEVAWYINPDRLHQVYSWPHWDADSKEKMRAPLARYNYSRITPAAIRLLMAMAWFCEV